MKSVECRICNICDNLGTEYPSDLDYRKHEGFTIGNGKVLYWMMIWHKSGHVTVFSKNGVSPRWINGDTIIKIHFK